MAVCGRDCQLPLALSVPTYLTLLALLSPLSDAQVCREFQRGNCKRSENECRFAHPADHVTVDSSDGGMVTVCMDYIKGRCTREQCRYFHPPPHLQAQLKAAQSRANAAAMVGNETNVLLLHHLSVYLSLSLFPYRRSFSVRQA